jgi:hypothetical protein
MPKYILEDKIISGKMSKQSDEEGYFKMMLFIDGRRRFFKINQ